MGGMLILHMNNSITLHKILKFLACEREPLPLTVLFSKPNDENIILNFSTLLCVQEKPLTV